MEILDRYPELAKQIELLCRTRCSEILSHMVETDNVYEKLCRKRADASMTLKEALDSINADGLIEAYSDAVYAQEAYELETIYRQAFCDLSGILRAQGLL